MSILERLFARPHDQLPRPSAATANVSHVAVAPPAAACATVPCAPSETEPTAIIDRRSQALRTMFPLLFSFYARPSELWHAIAVERFLAQAGSLAELEQRIEEVKRRRPPDRSD